MYDCNFVSFLPIQLPAGDYKIRASTQQGNMAETNFPKGRGSTSVDINF
jgi:hypothetical protein